MTMTIIVVNVFFHFPFLKAFHKKNVWNAWGNVSWRNAPFI